MRKKYKFLMCIMSIMMTICMLAGCAGEEDVEEIPITEVVDLLPSNILQFKVGKGDGPLTIIENPEQIQEICDFLSSAFILENQYQYQDKTFPTGMVGGMGGDYMIIVYSDKATTHIQMGKDATTGIAAGVQITGRTKEGEIKDKWRIYPLVNFSQQERLNEILSMSPAD
ncbi:MAG: hypothetical protein HFJ84_09765 [Clostridiales bacterium]|nr:hypothetical protein [Clostridiales bacterium]